MQHARWADNLALAKDGMAIIASNPMMPTTIIISTSVNPDMPLASSPKAAVVSPLSIFISHYVFLLASAESVDDDGDDYGERVRESGYRPP